MLSRLLVETSILLTASRSNPATILRDAASTYKVNTDAIVLKVKQEFAAKEKAKKTSQPTAKTAKKAACFHDADIAPGGTTLAETLKNLHEVAHYLASKMETRTTKLLWGTANLFSHPYFMAGVSTKP